MVLESNKAKKELEFTVPSELAELVQVCFQCGVCSGVCPVARILPGFLPRRMILDILSGESNKVVTSGHAWDCLTCGACQERCPMHIGLLNFISGIRAECLAQDINYCRTHDNVLGSLYRMQANPQLRPSRLHLLDSDVQIDQDSSVLYFIGCLPYFHVAFSDDVGFEGMAIANNTIRLLNHIGIKPAVSNDERCCGHDFLWRGELDMFEKLAKQNIELLEKYDLIITSCPECLRTLSMDYPERLGISPNVKHFSQVLVEQGEKFEQDLGPHTVTLHDSCRLGRHMKIFEPPRELLHLSGNQLVEMASHHQEAECCGVSAWINCNERNKMIRRSRMNEAIETGASELVTTCPKCQIHLSCLKKDVSEPEYPITIKDLASVLARTILKKED